MDNLRIAILDRNETLQTYFDTNSPESAPIFDDTLHEYLAGAASTFEFASRSSHPDTIFLECGNKIAFRRNGKDYYFNIQVVERDNVEVRVEAYSLSFELLNEQVLEYDPGTGRYFSEYLRMFDWEETLTIGHNEIMDRVRHLTFDKHDTILARLYALAKGFDSEIEFQTKLNDDYTIDKHYINIYKSYTDDHQGIGEDRKDITLEYGKNVSEMRKTTDSTELYTAITLWGDDDITIGPIDRKEYDKHGRVEFFTDPGSRILLAPLARDLFPSFSSTRNDRYIAHYAKYDTENVEALYSQALKLLKAHCTPKIDYDIDGYIDTNIGDTVYIRDTEFVPPLYLRARVSEQVRSISNPSKNKTEFSNYQTTESEVDPSLLARVQALIAAKKIYTSSIRTDNGILFKNGKGNTTLKAYVMDEGLDLTDTLTVKWFKDDVLVHTGRTLLVNASALSEKNVYRFEAYSPESILRGQDEATITNLEESVMMEIFSTNGLAFKNGVGDTTLNLTVRMGSDVANNLTQLRSIFGSSAKIKWHTKVGSGSYTEIPSSENAFQIEFTASPTIPVRSVVAKLEVD